MARSTDALRRDDIAQQAQGVGARLTAPVDNPALNLAGALAGITPEANTALQGIAERGQRDATLRAKHDALVASGAKLADAVRDGTLEPTSNPWYVQAYQRESAAVRGQASLSQLQLDSASWAEKSDPQAFAARWRESVGKIAEGFNSKDETAGFAPVESQFTQQALQSNVSQNVTRITEERKQNLSALASSALAQKLQQNGGTISPNEAASTLDPARIQFLATGGSQADWNEMVVGAVTSAAYATHNSSALDLLHAPELIHGASDGGNDPVGDGATGTSPPPPPLVPISPVSPADLTPGKRATSSQLADIVPFGGKVTSGVRSAEHNRAIGGAPNSQHVAGTAIDVVFPKGTTPDAVKAHYAAQGIAVDVIHEGAGDKYSTGDHFHIQGARNPVVPAAAAQPEQVASVQAQDTPALAAPPQAVSPTASEVRGPSLYDMAGVADKVESDRYRITQARENAQNDRLRALTMQDKVDGTNGYNAAYAAHGTKLLTGEVTSRQLIQEMTAAGYRPQAIAQTLQLVRGDLQDNAGVASARLALNSSDPSHARQVMDLAVEGLTGGLTKGYSDRVGQAVLTGQISGDDGVQMVSRAQSRSQQLESQARSDLTFSQSQQDRADGKTKVDGYKRLRQATQNWAAFAFNVVQQQGGTVTQKARTAVQQRLAQAGAAYMALHPDDPDAFAQASELVRLEMVKVVHETANLHRLAKKGASLQSTTTNTRRTN